MPRPGTDTALVWGMIKVILDRRLYDETYVEECVSGVDELQAAVKDFDLDFVEDMTGVPREDIVKAARIYATRSPASIFYAMGTWFEKCKNLYQLVIQY